MMLIKNSIKESPRSPVFSWKLMDPGVRAVPRAARAYFPVIVLYGALSGLTYYTGSEFVKYGLSWELLFLPIIAVSATVWGFGPSILALVMSLALGVALSINSAGGYWPGANHTFLIRIVAFSVYGLLTAWGASYCRRLRDNALSNQSIAKALESMMTPTAITPPPGYDLHGVYIPSQLQHSVGGNFYDFFSNGAGTYGVLIGDVAATGDQAALLCAELRYSARALAALGMNPASVLKELNRQIETKENRCPAVSLFFGILDVRNSCLNFSNAGHEFPMLVRSSGVEELLDGAGPALGIRFKYEYEERSITLERNDALLLLTDGVTEAQDSDGFFLNREEIWRIFRTALNSPTSKKTVSEIEESLFNYIGSGKSDDITMLLLRNSATTQTKSNAA
jgi:hypothetical protein